MPQPNILEYLPDVFAEVKEMKVHAQAERPEIERLWNGCDTAYNDQFLYNMTVNGCERWEKILGISNKGTDSLADRRFRIINRVNASLPYTYRMLEAKLIQMCGKDGYELAYRPESYTMRVRVALTRRNQLNEVHDLLLEMLPLNVVLDFALLFNPHYVLGAYTHTHLAQYTNKELMESKL